MNEWPKISIAVITKDRREDLSKMLQSLRECDYPKDKVEIVVVEEADEAKEIEGIKYVFIPRRNLGFGFARNMSVKHCTGDIVLFTDDDCIVEKDWIKKLVESFEPDVAGVGGTILVQKGTLIGQCETALGFFGGGLKKAITSKGKIQQVNSLSTGNCAYRRDVLEKAGLFNGGAKAGGEDLMLAKQVCAQNRCLYNPEAVVYHKAQGFGEMLVRLIQREKASLLVRPELRSWKHKLHRGLKNSIIIRVLILVGLLHAISMNRYEAYLIAFALYYCLLLVRERGHYRFFRSIRLLVVLPLVKMSFDLAMECGRIWALGCILRKPFYR